MKDKLKIIEEIEEEIQAKISPEAWARMKDTMKEIETYAMYLYRKNPKKRKEVEGEIRNLMSCGAWPAEVREEGEERAKWEIRQDEEKPDVIKLIGGLIIFGVLGWGIIGAVIWVLTILVRG